MSHQSHNLVAARFSYDSTYLRHPKRSQKPIQTKQELSVSVISPPHNDRGGGEMEGTATHPDVELYILVCHGLNVEADGRDGGDGLVELELVENG